MITRIWHGKTKTKDAEKYKNYVIETGIKDYVKSEGNLNTQIWQKEEAGETHIYTVTNWDNYDSIKKFAGEDFEKAKYYPEDEKFLLELEENVKHYKTFQFSRSRVKNYIRQIEELHDGDNWTDETFVGKIQSINKETAFTQPRKGKHSIAQILSHCLYWRRVTLKRIEGDFNFQKQTEEKQNFLSLEKLEEMGWDKLISEFNESYELLIEVLKTKDDDFLDMEYIPGYTNNYLIEGIIQHDYYHLGQIGYLISLLSELDF